MSVVSPRLVLLTLVAVTSTNLFAVPALAGLPVYTGLLGLATLMLALEVAAGRASLRPPVIVLMFGVALVAMLPAVLIADDTMAATSAMTELVKDLIFLLVVTLLATACASPGGIARVFAGPLAALGGLAMFNEFVLGNRTTFGGLSVLSKNTGVGVVTPRSQGPFDDPNFFGRVLTMALPFTLALAVTAWQRRDRLGALGWSGAAVAVLGGVYLTGSRGAMLGILAAGVAWMMLAGPGIRRALLVLPLVVVAVLFLPGVGSRMVSLDNLTGGQASFAEKDRSIVERTAALKVMLATFEANPVLGVGPANASTVRLPYVAAGGGDITRPVAAHNTYLQLLAETGVVGLAGWLCFLLGVITLALLVIRAHPVAPRAPPSADRLLAAAAAAAMVGWLLASVFLHLAFLRSMLVVAVIVSLLLGRAPQVIPQARRAARGPGRRRAARAHRFPVVTTVVGLILLASVVVSVRAFRSQVWVAEVPMTLRPAAQGGQQPDSYRQSLTTRRRIVASYAAVVRALGERRVAGSGAVLTVVPEGAASGTSLVASFRVQVRVQDRAEAERLARAIAVRGQGFIRNTPPLATFATVDVGPARVSRAAAWTSPLG